MGKDINTVIHDVMVPDNRILEMSGIQPGEYIDIPIDSRIDISTITDNDPDPKFVNVEIIRAGVSKTNLRRYSNMVIDEIGEMVVGRQGFLGHPDPSKAGFEFREPHTLFVGSTVQIMEDGTHRVIGKAYIFKGSPLREWIPKSIAGGRPMTVSINGIGDIVRNGEILDVIHMSEIESIDWANPGTEGVPTSKALSVVNEMQNHNNGGNHMEVKEVISNATVTEFKAYNPAGYANMIAGVSVTELREHNPMAVKAIEDGARVTEMQLTVGGETKTVKLTEMQSIIAGLEKKVSDLDGQIASVRLTEYKQKKLEELIPANIRPKIAGRISGNTEAEIDASITAEMTYIREMGLPFDFNYKPRGGNQGHSDDPEAKSIGESLFGSAKKADK